MSQRNILEVLSECVECYTPPKLGRSDIWIPLRTCLLGARVRNNRLNYARNLRRECCNTTQFLVETSLTKLESNAWKLHTTRITTIIDVAATEIRVDLFDMVKQKSNSAIKNVTKLSREGVRKILSKNNSPKEGDLRPHEQCPRKTEYYSHRFKTEGTVSITAEICRLSRCYLGKHVK